jgi:hypothetical protein
MMGITAPQVQEGTMGNALHPHDSNQLTHLYKCTNRKCSARKLLVSDSNNPLFYLSQPARIKRCEGCKAPMKHVRADYDRRVFRGKAPADLQLPDHDELLANISRLINSRGV